MVISIVSPASKGIEGLGTPVETMSPGSSVIRSRARQIVTEKLQLVAAQLPGSTSPPVLAPITSIMGEILLVGLTIDSLKSDSMTSDSLPPMEVRTVADWVVRKRLLAIPGVAQVVPIGGAVKQYQVLVHPDRLRSYGVTLSDVLRATESSNAIASGGVYLESGQEILIRGLGRVQQLADIEKTVVRLVNGTPVRIGDVTHAGSPSVVTQHAAQCRTLHGGSTGDEGGVEVTPPPYPLRSIGRVTGSSDGTWPSRFCPTSLLRTPNA